MQTTMRNKTILAAACGAVLWATGISAAQDEGAKSASRQARYFHLDFVVKEIEGGKVTNARHYTTITETGDRTCTFRSGNKVPLQAGGSTGLTYVDVGVNIDCRAVREIDGNLAINLEAEVSNLAVSSNPPVIRQTKWSTDTLVPIGKPTVICSSDDAVSKAQMQLELTATPIPAH